MKNVELVPFKPLHASVFDEIEGELLYLGESAIEFLNLNAKEGPAYSGIFQDQVIGCGGVRIFWAHVGEAWGIYPGSFYKNIREVFFYTKKMLHVIMNENNMRRVQATARVDLVPAQNWLRHLGFKREGRMNNYCPSGHDTYLYSITRD